MKLDVDGIIIMEKNISDSDKLITILTRKKGVIRAFVKNAKNIKNKNFSAIQLFAYSDFSIYKGRDKYIINEASLKNCFWDLRTDIKKVALAQYFCEIILNLVEENCESENILRLMLNSLYYLANGHLDNRLIKSVFELRILSMSGYMPDLMCCRTCKRYNNFKMYFDMIRGQLVCEDCLEDMQNKYELQGGVLSALRYIVYSDFNKMFSFDLEDKYKNALALITEKYLLRHVDRKICTLDFYKKVM
ncbi:MAG: DNA repair protein RecO [Eubacteriales bacterium SKADARSKE-1]|nr:DNA repair protein RecO [Eubacteriales bacterium SKADARSKE-1]